MDRGLWAFQYEKGLLLTILLLLHEHEQGSYSEARVQNTPKAGAVWNSTIPWSNWLSLRWDSVMLIHVLLSRSVTIQKYSFTVN